MLITNKIFTWGGYKNPNMSFIHSTILCTIILSSRTDNLFIHPINKNLCFLYICYYPIIRKALTQRIYNLGK